MRTRAPFALFAIACLAAGAAPAPSLAQGDPAPTPSVRTPGTVRVSATGEARATPDRAFADFGVETEAPTAQAAAAENARRQAAVIEALVRAGVERENIQTRDFSVFPAYDPTPNPTGGEPRVRGYRVTNTVGVQTDDVSRVGALIDAALAAGANRSYGLRFGFRDTARLQQQALQDAIRRARGEAEAIARGLGLTLGPVLEASTVAEPVRPVPMFEARAAMADQAQTPVEPGQSAVSATIHLVYRMN